MHNNPLAEKIIRPGLELALPASINALQELY